MTSIENTGPIPFPNSARGVQRPLTVRPLQSEPAIARTQGVGANQKPRTPGPVGSRLDIVDTTDLRSARSAALGELVAGRVNHPVDFAPAARGATTTQSGPKSGPAASASGSVNSGAYTMHARPSDLNAAATGVRLGRNLDVTG